MFKYIPPCSMFTNECSNIFLHVVYSQMNVQIDPNEKYWPNILENEYKRIVKMRERIRTGVFFHIKRWNVILPQKKFLYNYFLSGFNPMYLLESKIPNEYPNIFIRRQSLKWMSKYICFGKIHEYLNEEYISYKYLYILKYHNIRYTLHYVSSCDFSCYQTKIKLCNMKSRQRA